MKPYICPQCGGQVNRAKMICEYCGTRFQEENNVVRLMAYRPGVHTLQACVRIPEDEAMMSPKEMSEFAIRNMAEQFAEGIAQFMEVQTDYDPKDFERIFRARLRVLDGGYRF